MKLNINDSVIIKREKDGKQFNQQATVNSIEEIDSKVYVDVRFKENGILIGKQLPIDEIYFLQKYRFRLKFYAKIVFTMVILFLVIFFIAVRSYYNEQNAVIITHCKQI